MPQNRFIALAIAAVSLVLPAFAAPGKSTPLHDIKQVAGQTTGKYIVKFKDYEAKSAVVENLFRLNGGAQIAHDWDLIPGIAGTFNTEALDLLRNSPEVEYIEEDGFLHLSLTQENAPWGVSRLSDSVTLAGDDDGSLSFPYFYDGSPGSGVNIYVVGIRTTHTDFGGRAVWGATFGGYANADGNGHGTHVSGTAAGTTYGVAKAAKLIAVKVLSDTGSGTTIDVIDGLNWVARNASGTGVPSVVNISFGGSSSGADDAATALTKSGVHVVAAAGNSNEDAGTISPAHAPGVVAVGACNINDSRTVFSNYGSVVALFAPGQNVISAWSTSDTATNKISGTSMAAPHVSGLVAYFIALYGNRFPADMRSYLQNMSLLNVLSNIPSGTVNLLAHNGQIDFGSKA